MRLPQFRLSAVMLAIFWLCVSFAGWRLPDHLNMPGLFGTLVVSVLRLVPIAIAIGALFGHAWRGLVIGLGLWLCLIAFAFFALATWGGT
jgi:hypothetical protein